MARNRQLANLPDAITTDSSNNVGIGGSPSGSYKFEVTGTGRFTGALTTDYLTANGGGIINTTSAPFVLYNSGGGGNAKRFALNMTNGDYMKIYSLNDNGTTRTDNIITTTIGGNVGIGTTSPSNKLDIQSANGTAYTSTPQLRVGGGGVNNNWAQILFSDNALSDGKISYYAASAEADRMLSISARTTQSDFVIKGNGNVGIGTSSPSYPLEVIGAASLTSSGSSVLYLKNTAGTGNRNWRIVTNNAAAGDITFDQSTTDQGASYATKFIIGSSGQLISAFTYTNTTANAANMYIGSSGTFERSTASSQKFKENINDWNGNGLDTILSIKT